LSTIKNINNLNQPGSIGADDRAAANNSVKDSRNPKLLKAAQSFEGQFIRQMIAEMRKTVPKDELVGEGMADGIYREQLDNEYADNWVNQGGIGLADMIYEQLQQKYGNLPTLQKINHGEVLPLAQNGANQRPQMGTQNSNLNAVSTAGEKQIEREQKPRDILARADKDLFLGKKTPGGYLLKSKEPLPENVGLRSPLPGIVLQSASLGDGREMVVVKHDKGLVSQFVHSGHNRVKTNTQVAAGEVIAELPPSQKGEAAKVFFGLRPTSIPE
jgi:Rod binding domain-containing protein